MKRHLTILSAAAAVVIALTVSGCGGSAAGGDTGGAGAPGANEVKELRYQGWANTVTLPELAQDLGYLGDVKLNWVGNTISGPQDIQSAATGQTDFGGAFAGAVVKLVEAGAPVKAVINYYGEDKLTFNGFYVKEDSPIKTARDFIGKKIAVNTLGAHSEAVINTYLRKNGLSAEEIKQVQLVVVPPNDTEEAIRRGQVDAGSLGSILQDRAIANGGLRSVFSDFDLFGSFAGGPYVLREDFIAQNPNTTRTFTTAVAKAIEWERTTPRKEVIAKGEIKDEDFTRWNDYLKSVGIIKDDLDPKKLYTNEFNGLVSK